MDVSEKINKLLAQYKDSEIEYEYFNFTLSLIQRLNTPISEAYGFAWMNVLHWTTVYTSENVFGELNSQMGSFDDLSEIVAVIFAEVNDNPTYWKIGRSNFPDNDSLLKAEQDILLRLKKDDIITRVVSYLNR